MSDNMKRCKNCSKQFEITDDDRGFYQKIDVPEPTLCPECRYIRRLLDRNEWNLFKRKCDATGKDIISIYRADSPFPVYNQDYWKSDSWDPLAYGRDFDFDQPFFPQYEKLRQVVPHLAIVNSNSVNSEYTNQSQDNKDCYMCSATGGSEKCMYGNWYQPTNYLCADCYSAQNCELCYESLVITKCSRCLWCEECSDSQNLLFCRDCRNCSDCIGCVGLRNKKYCYFNEQLDKQEFERRREEVFSSRANILNAKDRAKEIQNQVPTKYYHGLLIENSTGDYIGRVKNVKNSFNCYEVKDSSHCQDAWLMENALDITEIYRVENSFELQGCSALNNCMVLRSVWTASDSDYCDICFTIQDCFGCFGLSNKQFCILNKQYSKEEYFSLRKKIVAHMKQTEEWGEYFPPEYSPWAYNESVAQDYFPLSKEEALKNGYSWRDPEERNYQVTMESEDLPQTILTTRDDILKETVRCKSQKNVEAKNNSPLCATAFRMVPLELELYRKLGIPVPEYCFPCRRTRRFALRNPRRLWHRKCMRTGCPNKFETTYAPDRLEIVYCEQCYNSEVA